MTGTAQSPTAAEPLDGADGRDGADGHDGRTLRGVLRDRWLVGAVAALGILCAATTTIWPTKIVALRTPEVGDFTKGFEHRIWSWGREAVFSSDGVPFDAYSGPVPTLALVFLVVVLALGAVGVIAWLVVHGHRGQLLGVAGCALAAAVVVQSVVARLAVDDRTLGLQPGLVVVTPVAGRLQYAAAILLVAALVLMLVPRLPPSLGGAARWLGRVALVRTARSRAGEDDDLMPRRAAVVIRDAPPSGATAPGVGSAGRGNDEGVDFSDVPARPVE